MATSSHIQSVAEPVLTPRQKIMLTCSNALMLIGSILLLYVGGLYATDMYGAYAARGDTDAPAVAVAVAPSADTEPAPFIAPVLADTADANLTSPLPSAAATPPEVTRIVISSINVDAKVIPVGWDVVEEQGQRFAVWQVAKYAVGQHIGSANPGDGGNIVLAGHVGGFGKVFRDLYYVKPGDQLTLYRNGEQYLYTVTERLIVTEEGVSNEQRAKNAELIAETDSEVATLVTCWPPTGADKYTQRIVVRAVPFGSTLPEQEAQPWVLR